MGAQLVTESSDILQDLNITESLAPEPTGGAADSPAEAIVLGLLSSSPVAADELVARSGLVAATLSTALTLLEMKGRIKNVGGQQYIKVR
jgi:DNA processing protein